MDGVGRERSTQYKCRASEMGTRKSTLNINELFQLTMYEKNIPFVRIRKNSVVPTMFSINQ